MVEEVNQETSNLVEDVLGDLDGHSPDKPEASGEATGFEETIGDWSGAPKEANASDDSAEAQEPNATPQEAPKESASNAEPAHDTRISPDALMQEINVLKKRLHDTQQAMHAATSQRSEMQKELEALRAKREDEDSWFSEEDTDREAKLTEEMKRSEESIAKMEEVGRNIEQNAARAIWDMAASAVKEKHADFEEVVYEKFAPMLEPETGDPRIRAMWEAEADKSPANAYAFAKRVPDILNAFSDPQGYRDRLRKEIEEENRKRREQDWEQDTGAVLGKEGLDMLNSADYAPKSPRKTYSNNVDYVLDFLKT